MIDPVLRLLWALFCSIVIALLSMYQRAHAYVPKAKTILEKTAKNHGKGHYSIQLEVSFRNESGTQTINENWLIENGEEMFVEAQGAGFQYLAVYHGKQKYFMDESGGEKSTRIPADFFEDTFHFRGAESLASELIAMNIVPPKISLKEIKPRSLKEIKNEREAFVRLSRSSGVINYALGKPTPADSTNLLPGIWIEQDLFHIRRIRFPSHAEIYADDYSEYGRGLYYPKTRTINWGQNSVSIRTIKVSAINPTAEQKAKLSPSFLRSRKQGQLQMTASETDLTPLIREFYQKYR